MEMVLAKYVSREGDFEFLHCFNCGQDFYKEVSRILDPGKSDVKYIILKKMEVEIDRLINPQKYTSIKRSSVNLN